MPCGPYRSFPEGNGRDEVPAAITQTIPSITIELYVKSSDGSSSFAVMPGCELDGFQDFADENKLVHCFLKATDVGTMCYALDEEEPAKILRVYEGNTPGIAIKKKVVGTAAVLKGSDIVAIQEGRSATKKKSKEKAASVPAPAAAAAATAAGKASTKASSSTSTPAKPATDVSADTTTTATTASKKKKKKDKTATKKKSAEAPADLDKDKEDTPEKPAAPAPATTKPKAAGKKGKDPNAPKRAMNAYMHYSSANRAKIKEADKEASVSDVAKKLGEAWRGLSDNERKCYEDLAAQDKERYQKEMEAYNSKKDSTDKSADEPATEPTEKKSKAKAKTVTKKASEKKAGKATDTSKASASSKKKDAPAANAATTAAAGKPQAKPKHMSQAAKRAEEKKEIDMLQAKFLKLPKKDQDAAISNVPVTADRVHTLGEIGKDILQKALSKAGIVLDGGGDDDNDSSTAAGASTKKKAPSTPKSKAKASYDITSPNAQKFEQWESLTEAPEGFKFPPSSRVNSARASSQMRRSGPCSSPTSSGSVRPNVRRSERLRPKLLPPRRIPQRMRATLPMAATTMTNLKRNLRARSPPPRSAKNPRAPSLPPRRIRARRPPPLPPQLKPTMPMI